MYKQNDKKRKHYLSLITDNKRCNMKQHQSNVNNYYTQGISLILVKHRVRTILVNWWYLSDGTLNLNGRSLLNRKTNWRGLIARCTSRKSANKKYSKSNTTLIKTFNFNLPTTTKVSCFFFSWCFNFYNFYISYSDADRYGFLFLKKLYSELYRKASLASQR